MAVVPSGVPSVVLGGIGFNNTTISGSAPGALATTGHTTEVFTIQMGVLSLGGSNVHYPFKKNGALYQVTAGKRFIASVIKYKVGSATGGFQLVSATATFADATAAASLTGGVFQSGTVTIYPMAGHQTAATTVVESFRYVFAASTWPGVQCADNTQIYQISLTGSEET